MNFVQNSCLRKLRHTNYLTALLHASCLANDGRLVIYPCGLCGGLHVGHLRQRSCPLPDPALAALDRDQLEKRIRRAQRRLQHATCELKSLADANRDACCRVQQRINDRRRHLALLRSVLFERIMLLENSEAGILRPDRAYDDVLPQAA